MHLIVNPAAAGGRVGKQWPRIHEEIKAAGFDAPLEFTRAPGHATELAASAVRRGADIVVAAGGDGTICEVVQGLHDAGRGTLGILPLGTGNDAARTLGLPLSPADAARVLLAARRRRVDLMQLGDRVVFNAIGIGLLGSINVNAAAIKVVRGIAAYLAAAAGTLFTYHPIPIELEGEGLSYVGGMTILALHNGVTTGGGFRLTPGAVCDDGELDGCLVGPIGVPTRLARLVAALKGTLGEKRGSQAFRFRRLRLSTAVRLPSHLDGNPYYIEPPGTTIEVLPGALEVVAGAEG
jgi:YegS/Rv2252/BmrU family lipid kinase